MQPEQAGHSQSVATVIARPREHNNRGLISPSVHDGMCNGFGSPFHKIYASNGLMLDGISVELVYLRGGKYLHTMQKYEIMGEQ